ncbi:MAG: hypothetical protein HYX72_10445 [Acidobacteria bacterium]|nr:hypothetical protein [Acidobacteriota bacterium]
MITRNWDIGAGYTSRSANIIILNANMFDHTRSRDVFEEFCVTVLHELLHFFQKGADETYTSGSEEEARHDLATYGLLGIGIPVHHWAFKVYPHLLTELQQPGVGK